MKSLILKPGDRVEHKQTGLCGVILKRWREAMGWYYQVQWDNGDTWGNNPEWLLSRSEITK